MFGRKKKVTYKSLEFLRPLLWKLNVRSIDVPEYPTFEMAFEWKGRSINLPEMDRYMRHHYSRFGYVCNSAYGGHLVMHFFWKPTADAMTDINRYWDSL